MKGYSAETFERRKKAVIDAYERVVYRPNPPKTLSNGVYLRYMYPVLTAAHAPVHWRYDLNPDTNPLFLEQLGINAAFNAGAIKLNGKYYMVARVEGVDRKSFFAVAESESPTEGFTFWDEPVVMPETADPDVNVYDMRLTQHQDGWIYGVFCTERKDPNAPAGDLSSAIAQAGIARTKDLKQWERLADLKTSSPQQRNVVLHPEFVDGKFAFYTRPQDGFISAGSGGGVAWGLSDSIENAHITQETLIDARLYHTIKEVKNGQGPTPLKTEEGWVHLAHGVRNTAAGLRYVLYLFVTDLKEPWKVIYAPGGHFMAPEDEERVGDVSNVLFSNGWILDDDGSVYIYYASSDTRMHVAKSRLDWLLDYAKHTPQDPLTSAKCVAQRIELIQRNQRFR